MKVSFKLNLAQLARARAQVLTTEYRDSLPHSLDNHEGNLVGWVEDHGFSYNPNQHLELKDDTITYVGERCPFQQDGMFRLLGEILTGDKTPVKRWWCNYDPIDYETSDTRLRWHETLQIYLYERASLEEVVSYINKPATRWGDITIIPSFCQSVQKDPEVSAAVKAVGGLIYHGRGSQTRLSASFSVQTLKTATVIAKAISPNWF